MALLKTGAKDDVNVRRGNESPLHVATARGVEKLCKLLLHAGANNPNLPDDRKRTPLHVAAEAGRGGIVSDMLLKGARPNAKDGTSLRKTALHLAASRGHVRCVSELLLAGADKDAPDNAGTIPIHLAVLGGHVGLVEELCAACCNLMCRARDGFNALDLAMVGGNIDVFRVLLTHYGDVSARDDRHCTLLHRAASCLAASRDAFVRLLLEAGADPETTSTALKLTPLHRASRRHLSSGTVLALLEAGANVNAIARDGSTPLHYACSQSNAACVEVLLHWWADETLEENFGLKPWSEVGAWEEDDPGGDDEVNGERRADDERIRQMLERAPAYRSWRRRGWLVLCRSCPDKVQLTHGSNARDTGKSATKLAKASGEVSGKDPDFVESEAFGRFVSEMVGLEGDGVFRMIVTFL